MSQNIKKSLTITEVPIEQLKELPGNPRSWSDKATSDLTESLKRFEIVEPLVVNYDNTVLGGNFRLSVAKKLDYKTVPCVYVDIRDEQKAKELSLRLNKNQGEFDLELLAEFDETLLADVGFDSEEIDEIFNIELDEPDTFDLQKELDKLDITVEAQKGDVYQLGDSRLMVGDSTIEADVLKLMNGQHADMVMTDPPYILDYLHAKRGGKPVTGFGAKRNRRYLETDVLPDNFTELWMANVAKVAKPDFSIIVYENWKNLRVIWQGLEDNGWKVKNMIVWHLPNRHQGFSAKYKFFSKHDIAMVGGSGTVEYNHKEEPDGLQEEYETALYAIAGRPQWEGYQGGKRYQPTDFVDYQASDEKSSGQGVIFGTKPIEILIPYIKVLTRRDDLVLEPFCGSGSTLIAATKLKRRCYIMEKSPTYAEVAMKRWEKLTGLKREKLS